MNKQEIRSAIEKARETLENTPATNKLKVLILQTVLNLAEETEEGTKEGKIEVDVSGIPRGSEKFDTLVVRILEGCNILFRDQGYVVFDFNPYKYDVPVIVSFKLGSGLADFVKKSVN